MRKITFTSDAYAEYVNWLQADQKIFLKITELIREASRDSGKGIGKPELLKHELSGHWSRRNSVRRSQLITSIVWFIQYLKLQLKSDHVNTIIKTNSQVDILKMN